MTGMTLREFLDYSFVHGYRKAFKVWKKRHSKCSDKCLQQRLEALERAEADLRDYLRDISQDPM